MDIKIERRYNEKKKMDRKNVLGFFVLAIVSVLGISLISAYGLGIMNHEDKGDLIEQKQAIQEAIETNDFETWKVLMQEQVQKMQDRITEENFNQIVEGHKERLEIRGLIKEAKESGDLEEVERLKEEAGFNGKGLGNKMNKGFMNQNKNQENCPYQG